MNKKVYYLAIQYYGVIPKIRDSKIPLETLLNNWVEEYGLDLIGIFEDKQEAITYLVNETGLSDEECALAYDFYMKISGGVF